MDHGHFERSILENRENNPMQSKMGPSSQHSCCVAFGHEKKNGPSSRPSLISSRARLLRRS